MAVHIVTVDGKQIVFGLSWVPLSGDVTEKKEVREHVREHDAAFLIKYAGEHSVVYGFLAKENIPEDVKKPQLLSAAVLLATKDGVNTRSIFIEVETQYACLAIIDGGVPVPGGDFYGPINEVQEIIRQVMDDATDIFTIYSNNTELYGDAVPLTLAELLVEGDNEHAKLVKVGAEIDGKVIALAIITLVLGVGYFGYDYYRVDQARKALEASRNKPVLDPNKMYAEVLSKALLTAGLPGPQAAIYFSKITNGLEMYVAGWRLSEVNCVPEGCTYVWDISGGTNMTFMHAMGNRSYEFGTEGTQIKYFIALDARNEELMKAVNMPNFTEFTVTVGSFRQNVVRVGMQMSIEAPVIFGDVTGIVVSAIKSPVRRGSYTIEGPQAVANDVLGRTPAYMTVNAYSVKIDGVNPKFKIEGYYYVKN